MKVDYAVLYEKNKDYRRYVDACAKDAGKTPAEMMEQVTIKLVGDMYASRPEGYGLVTKTEINAGCGGGC